MEKRGGREDVQVRKVTRHRVEHITRDTKHQRLGRVAFSGMCMCGCSFHTAAGDCRMLTLPDYETPRKIPRHHSSGGTCLFFATPSPDPPQTFFNKVRKMKIYQLLSSLTIIFTLNTTSIILSMWMLASG